LDRNSHIFVAGHQGLIGSAVVRRLQQEGYRNLALRTHGELELADAAAVAEFFSASRPEYVVLAAGRVGGILENNSFPADFLGANLAIQQSVFAAAHRSNVRRLIFFASSCMYPRDCPQPMAETALLSGKPEPTSMAYAIAKLAGVQMCLAYNAQFGEKRFLPLIPNSAYGPNDNFDPASGHVLSALIARFCEAKALGSPAVTLWGSGSPRREFVHADDIADACVHLLREDVTALEFPVNIGVGEDVTIRELAENIARIVGYEGRLEWDRTKPDGAPRKLLDGTRLRTFGWRASIRLDQGLQDACRWYVQGGRKVADAGIASRY
jgi:GDP-L-fucose synthase